MGLVVVRDSKVVGLHCSGAELHAGQAAIIQHGAQLADCQLYFSRRPCATCFKMIINGEKRGEGWMEGSVTLKATASNTLELIRFAVRSFCSPPSAGVSQISFWPGDPEISMLTSNSTNRSVSYPCSLPHSSISEEAALDAVATEKLKSNSRPHICVLLQPLAPGLVQFVDRKSRECDFMEKMTDDDPRLNTDELFNRYPGKNPNEIVKLPDDTV